MRKLPLKLTLIAISTVYHIAAIPLDAPLIKNVTEGEPVSLTCSDSSHRKISWFKDSLGKRVQILNDVRRQTDQEGTLHFSYVEVTDTALYICGLSGANSIQLVSPVQLNVKKGEANGKVPVRLLKSSGNTEAKLGENVTLQCFFSGRPAPSVSWLQENKKLDNNEGVTISGGLLTIKNVTEKNTGTYRCTGQSGDASQEAELYLNVIGPNTVRTTITVQREAKRTAGVKTDEGTAKSNPVTEAWSSSGGRVAATGVVVVAATFLLF